MSCGTAAFGKVILRQATWRTLIILALCCSPIFSQEKPAPNPNSLVEFPVVMRQNVEAGKTPIGEKVQAKLVMATLVNGTLIPRDATLSGEVTESIAKSANSPSRLAIRMQSAQWKNGSAPVAVYLTQWFYPLAMDSPQNLSYQPADAANSPRNWNGGGAYPDPNNPVSQQKFPGRDSDDNSRMPSASPASSISTHRALLKNIESIHNSDGSVTLSSARSNIKLDKTTTYVLSSGELTKK